MGARRVQGMGSAYIDARGRFCWSVVATVTGRKKRFQVAAKTAKERDRKAKALRKKLDAGTAPSAEVLSGWMTYWLDHVAAAKVRPVTIQGYLSKVARYIVPNLGMKRLDRITATDVRELHEAMAAEGLSPATIRQTHAILGAALRVAADEGKIDRNPCAQRAARPPAVERRPHPIMTPEQARTVIDTCTDTRMRARLMVALLCGLRQGEALGLEWADVHETDARPTIRVRQALTVVRGEGRKVGPTKSRRSDREVPLFPAASEALEAWRRESGGVGYVFPADPRPGRALDPMALRDPSRDAKDWAAALAAAGVAHIPLHGARGTLATILMSQGVPDRVIADILGHDVAVDLRHYQHSDDTQRRAAIASAGRELEGYGRPARSDEQRGEGRLVRAGE